MTTVKINPVIIPLMLLYFLAMFLCKHIYQNITVHFEKRNVDVYVLIDVLVQVVLFYLRELQKEITRQEK